MNSNRQTEIISSGIDNNSYNVKLQNLMTHIKNDDFKHVQDNSLNNVKEFHIPKSNTHTEVFNTLLKQVSNSPQELILLKILQHLLLIENKHTSSNQIWNTTEEVVLRAIQSKSQEELDDAIKHDTADKLEANLSSATVTLLALTPPAPPPPPPEIKHSPLSPCTEPNHMGDDSLLPQQKTPTPKSKMKTLCWDKIPHSDIVGHKNLWTILASHHKKDSKRYIDWNEAESLFSLQSSTIAMDTLKRKEKLKLLNRQRTFNVDIFLEQFKGYKSDNAIIELIYGGNHQAMGAEKINRLQKLLPEIDEIEVLKNFSGNRDTLARAEKFLLQLIEVSHYKLRIECMSLKEEFNENVQYLKSSIKLVMQAGNELINNKKLHEVLYIIVLAGNFLNSGKYAGKAAAIKVSSLLKLTQMRANSNNMHFMHFVVSQVKESHPELMNFANDFKNLEKINRINMDQIFIDTKYLNNRLLKVELELPSAGKDIKQQMMKFLEKSKSQMQCLETGLKNVESMRINLAKFFCEDVSKFSLRECFKIFQTFAGNFKLAANERNEFEIKTLMRQKQKEKSSPDTNLTLRSFAKTKPYAIINDDFIRKEINRELKQIGDVNKFLKPIDNKQDDKTVIFSALMPTTEKSNGSEEIVYRRKRSTADETRKSDFEPKYSSVAEKVQMYLASINKGTEESENIRFVKNENENSLRTTQRPNKLENLDRLSNNSFHRLKLPESPTIAKYEKIGKRMSSINAFDLQDIIPKLKPTPGREKSLWNIPREKLIRNSNYHEVSASNAQVNYKQLPNDHRTENMIDNKNKSSDSKLKDVDNKRALKSRSQSPTPLIQETSTEEFRSHQDGEDLLKQENKRKSFSRKLFEKLKRSPKK